MGRISTIAVWAATLACLAIGAVIAALFGFMATAIDPTDAVTAGVDATGANMIETWGTAVEAAVAFVVLVVACAIGLRLWHTARFKALAVAITAAEMAAVSWACVVIYREYW